VGAPDPRGVTTGAVVGTVDMQPSSKKAVQTAKHTIQTGIARGRRLGVTPRGRYTLGARIQRPDAPTARPVQ
jgi:hypothetical protein